MAANRYDSSYTGIEHDTYVTKSQLVDLIYPVGSIYISLNNTNPTALFGGSWDQITGRFLLGTGTCTANSDNSYFGTIKAAGVWNAPAGSTGGEDWHTLTQAETPAHTHTRGTMEISGTLGIQGIYSEIGANPGMYGTGAFARDTRFNTKDVTVGTGWQNGGYNLNFYASRNWTGSTSSIGGNGNHNNMPPYLAVYIWKRVA